MNSLVISATLVIAIVFPTLATLAVGLRFYVRRLLSQRPGAEEWTVLIALLMCWGLSIITFVVAGIGGVNTSSLEPATAVTFFVKALWVEGVFLRIGLASIKISVLLFYRRIFVTKNFRRCVDVMIAILVGWCISAVIAQLLAGKPISGVWKPVPSMRYDYGSFGLANAGMGIVFDVVVLCFPLPVIKNLQMKTRRKLMIVGIFWLGGFCCIAAAVRFWFLYQEIYSASSSRQTNRYTYMTQGYLWSEIEPNCSVIAACLPTFGPLFTHGRSTVSRFHSLRSFLSFTYWWPVDRKTAVDGVQNSGRESTDIERITAGQAWQKIERSNNSVNIASARPERDNVEGQPELSTNILVTRGFGSEYGES